MSSLYYEEFKKYEEGKNSMDNRKKYELLQFMKKILDENDIEEFFCRQFEEDNPEFFVLYKKNLLKFDYTEYNSMEFKCFPLNSIKNLVFVENRNAYKLVITFNSEDGKYVLDTIKGYNEENLINFTRGLNNEL
ncbi:MAG: hypothetical protein LKJ66_14560 [Clostridium luticellarii]|uniref:hypothetical protein n=1 Tax=Clostridium luticellarii TaxID=1691940 RepID=UPI0023568482|nr:hypothetical protein [Clostridium luticellarii]MCI1996748.1 hypothetical protein [Clostridium luticellarii]MCI2041271.1 hypothetical protein [Clostridium luticellarii]